ncbi:MAG: hypothetical protein ABEI39_02715 [Halobacteriales archaeon]
MSGLADSVDMSTIVLLAHAFVGLGMAGLGAYRYWAFRTVIGAVVNAAIGVVILVVGYRLSKLV